MTQPPVDRGPGSRHYGIVPAAGRSRRMGQPKLLLPFQSATVIQAVLAAWREGGVDEVLVVCHREDSGLIAVCRAAGALVVVPSEPPPQMKDSVAAALSEIAARFEPTPADAFLLAPADLPRLSAQVIRLLIAAHDPREQQIMVPLHNHRRGHPALFSWHYASEIAALGDHEGVNALLDRHRVVEIAAGADALARDVDTPDDYRQLQ